MRIQDPYGHVGTVVHTLNGLDEACQYGALGPDSEYTCAVGDTTDPYTAVTDWLQGLERTPRTPRTGTWFIVAVDGGGEVIVGALDVTFLDN
jgi:hypothetical protein